MQSNVKGLFWTPLTVFVMSAVTGLVSGSPAAAQEFTAKASRVPATTLVESKVLPSPVLVNTATATSQASRQSLGRPAPSPENRRPVIEENAFRIIEAALLSKNGPNGGWCWLVTTDCGDQYQKGDCWYTESLSETRKSSH